jgi:hypothetical protein
MLFPQPIRIRRRTSVRRRATAVGITALAVLTAATTAQAAVGAPVARAAAAAVAVRPGLNGPTIQLANNVQFSGYDLASGPNGTAYLGWIDAKVGGRQVHLCTLPRGATKCAGGIQTIASAPDSLGTASAHGLRVLVSKSDLVSLVWMYDTIAAESGPEGDEIAVATALHGQNLTAGQASGVAPSFGTLLDATLAPNGSIWTVAHPSGGVSSAQVTRGLGNAPQTVKTPFWPAHAVIAFSGAGAVLAIDQYGQVTKPVYYARQSGAGWTGFKAVAKTWNTGGFGLAATNFGVRLIATQNNANYHPVVSALTSTGFSAPTLTGDVNNCAPFDHDAVADASGRLADVSEECGVVAVANLANTRRAAIFRFNVHGTFAGGDPQLTTSPSGHGWVAWSIESTTGNKLLVAPLLLPGLDITVTTSAAAGRVTVTGPASCLPPVDVTVGVAAKPAAGWRVTAKALKLGSALIASPLHGAGLTPGKSYTLTGTATLAKGASRSTLHTTLTFRTCPKP